MHAYPGQDPHESADIQDYVPICMEVAGYQWDLKGASCTPTYSPWRNPWCYRPTTQADGG